MKRNSIILFGILIFVASSSAGTLAKPDDNNNLDVLKPQFAPNPPKIDGRLDDEIWGLQSLNKDFITYNPLYGEIFPQKTVIWLAYDNKNLYFAFKCYDTEPEKIKTSITRRDNIFSDDWVGLSLDALGNKQMAYDLFCNPNGIQGDILNSAVSGEDLSPDFVWESAGQITDEGYQVEICIPLRSIRFKSGKEVKMGILFWRRISRLGLSGSWPDLKPGHGIFNIHTTVVFKDLKSPLNLEILPNVTFGSNTERNSPQEWGKSDTFQGIGIGFKYGITSSITADITVNPDFSQVESDAFQVEVNRRYPIFYSEKRPFFMEGTDIFDFFTIGHGYFNTPVHTRRIVDPLWGAKLTGTVGKTAIGILSASDEWPGLAWDSGENPYLGKNAFFTIARGKHSLKGDNYIGALYSGREFSGGFNRVAGVDLSYRFLTRHQVQASFLQSFSRESEEESSTGSQDYNLTYSYFTRALGIAAAYEHIGKDFRMDSAFLTRTGIDEAWVWFSPSFYPNPEKMSWLKRINPQITYQYLHDNNTNMNDDFFRIAVDFSFTKQGGLGINYIRRTESWNGQAFHISEFNIGGGIQITKWLRLGSGFALEEQIYYPADPPFKGDGYQVSFDFTLQPSSKLSVFFSFYRTDLNRDNENIYDVNIIYSRITYQFNKYLFVRALIQYDSFQKRILTDFLASFTLIPGTVLHVGYGGLYEKRRWQDNDWIYGEGDMFNTRRSFFFKASYLWRF